LKHRPSQTVALRLRKDCAVPIRGLPVSEKPGLGGDPTPPRFILASQSLRRRQLLGLFTLEALWLGLVGASIGASVGMAVGSVVSWIGIPMPPAPGMDMGFTAELRLSVPVVGIGAAVGLCSTFIAALFPAWKGASIPIVTALDTRE